MLVNLEWCSMHAFQGHAQCFLMVQNLPEQRLFISLQASMAAHDNSLLAIKRCLDGFWS
jgi:hypothetical protein